MAPAALAAPCEQSAWNMHVIFVREGSDMAKWICLCAKHEAWRNSLIAIASCNASWTTNELFPCVIRYKPNAYTS